MKKIYALFIIACLLLSFTSYTQQPSFIDDSLDSYIQQGMKDWNIPGLAVAIVKDGKVVLMKGYGVRDLQTKEPVDENTLFMIASNSKLFTATSLAQLEYDKKLSLNDKITKFFPDYRVYDTTTTELVNIRDMLSHHLGTKTFQGDFTFWNSKLSRQQIIYRMRFLKPSQNFRQSYGYCNSCFLTAGEIIPVVSGKPWEVYVYDSIVEPLQMSNTHTLGYGMEQMPDAAKPYTNVFSKDIVELPYDQIDNLGPAGSMVSCVNDLSHWLMMQLDSGRYNGKQILPWAVVQRTREMNTVINSRKNPFLPVHIVGYCLGLEAADYAGRQIYWHTGGADGFVTNVCFVPEENLGITILTNNDNQNFFELLRYQILDAYLGVPYMNRSLSQLAGFKSAMQQQLNEINGWKARIKGNKPDLSLSSYAGIYSNQLYGNISISQIGNQLKIDFGTKPDLSATLDYMDNGEWLMQYNNIEYGIFSVKFDIVNSKVKSITTRQNEFVEYDPYTFMKK